MWASHKLLSLTSRSIASQTGILWPTDYGNLEVILTQLVQMGKFVYRLAIELKLIVSDRLPAFIIAAYKKNRASYFMRNPKLDINIKDKNGLNVAWYCKEDVDLAVFNDKNLDFHECRDGKSLLDWAIEVLKIPVSGTQRFQEYFILTNIQHSVHHQTGRSRHWHQTTKCNQSRHISSRIFSSIEANQERRYHQSCTSNGWGKEWLETGSTLRSGMLTIDSRRLVSMFNHSTHSIKHHYTSLHHCMHQKSFEHW